MGLSAVTVVTALNSTIMDNESLKEVKLRS